ncbi:MAG: hypothetical protein C3F02_00690 [Parcubacteria group bacterium]|nr:MAG: hypothetical protein C3F02_00690 [Parcubacteria group bacterium]
MKILKILLIIILLSATAWLLYNRFHRLAVVDDTKAGPGTICNYVFKGPYDFSDKAVFLLNAQGNIDGWSRKLGPIQKLEQGYYFMPHYDCRKDFYKTNVLANVASEDWDSLSQNKNDLILKDTYSEFYYCTKNAATLKAHDFNNFIENNKLSEFCERLK